MERTHIAVLAIVVAVVAVFAFKLWSGDTGPQDERFAADVAPGMLGADGTRVRRIPFAGEDPARPGSERKKPGAPGGGVGPGGTKRDATSSGAHGAAQVVAGLARRGGAVGGGVDGPGGGAGADGLAGDDAGASLAARGAALAPPRGGHDVNVPPADPSRRTFEFVDDNKAAADGVLLSLPLDGKVDPAAGGEPTQASGLVVNNDGGVEFTEDANLTIPAGGNVKGDAGSISFEIKPNWAGSDQTNNSLVQIRDEHVWENSLEVVKNLNSLRFLVRDENGVETNVATPISDWQPGESHQIAVTWGDQQMSLYIDRQLVGQQPLPNNIVFNDTTPIHVGSDFPGASYSGAGGTIRDFQVYGRTLTADEIIHP